MIVDMALKRVEAQFSQMSRYLDVLEASIRDNQEETSWQMTQRDRKDETTIQEKIASENEIVEIHEDAFIVFPRFVLSGFIISWYSFVEYELLEYCVRLKLTIILGPKDNKGLDRGIRRARNFLKDAANHKFDPNDWEELVKIGKLRNQIVHNGHDVMSSSQKFEGKCAETLIGDRNFYLELEQSLFDYLETYHLIDLVDPSYVFIVPTIDYCRYLVQFGKNMFGKLYNDKDLRSRRTVFGKVLI